MSNLPSPFLMVGVIKLGANLAPKERELLE